MSALFEVTIVVMVRAGCREGTEVIAHTVADIDPSDPANMPVLLAFELTQATPQSFCLNELAPKNM